MEKDKTPAKASTDAEQPSTLPKAKSKINLTWVMGGTIIVQLLIIIALVVFIAFNQMRRPMMFQGAPTRIERNGDGDFIQKPLEIKP